MPDALATGLSARSTTTTIYMRKAQQVFPDTTTTWRRGRRRPSDTIRIGPPGEPSISPWSSRAYTEFAQDSPQHVKIDPARARAITRVGSELKVSFSR